MGAGALASASLAVAGSATAKRSVDPSSVDTSFLSDDVTVQSCWTESKCESVACSTGGGCLLLERTCCDGVQSVDGVGTSETTCGEWEEAGCCTC